MMKIISSEIKEKSAFFASFFCAIKKGRPVPVACPLGTRHMNKKTLTLNHGKIEEIGKWTR
jgi:hypothetical protein